MKTTVKKEIRVRIAPSPTGSAHIGTARTALFNYLFAKKNKGKFVLRIEDTDKERSEQKWTDEILTELRWLGIKWDEGPDIGGKFSPYKQTQRMDIYKKYLEKLLSEKKSYYCFCSEEELESKRQDQLTRGVAPKYDGKCRNLSEKEIQKKISSKEKAVIRFKVADKKIRFLDLIRGMVEFNAGLLGDVVIAKDLGTPLYHFAVVVDDFEMQISHIIRGEEHLSNTPRQILLQEALGFYQPVYAHLPLMLNMDKSKMSKRQGDVAISDYHKNGYLPEALINFMALLGWNPGTEKEIFSLAKLVKEFSIEKVQKAGAIFNVQRLDFINGFYIREKPIEKLTELCIPYLKEAGLLIAGQISENKLEKIIEVSKTRMKKLFDIVELSGFFFVDKVAYDKNLLKWDDMKDGDIKDALLLCDKTLSELKDWEIKKIEEALMGVAGEFNRQKGYPEKNRGFLLWPMRVALSGKQFSPSPFEISDILGREKTLKRIRGAVEKL
ncbi:MAG: glutamate--tRNA ligase [Candidatus Staskawiczbacteria bacterium RIFCSPLOWO2_12_FULL_37_15]|uniref:Glutamate--tRNA ligase n=1 Tax=Candidatus Staskawiczbacteria bacterium RIFCSPLOWO2_12_FULL_37_15 TaxID=1802218 RepID=A0A1G2IRN8_9BACT|nr:MAG: glutamate--tRNA ligase [Candidatus Staskawiczbacteria bacterium RIFCSPLOWO2_12_FULL_37_15]